MRTQAGRRNRFGAERSASVPWDRRSCSCVVGRGIHQGSLAVVETRGGAKCGHSRPVRLRPPRWDAGVAGAILHPYEQVGGEVLEVPRA
jgi:hypothetical protein